MCPSGSLSHKIISMQPSGRSPRPSASPPVGSTACSNGVDQDARNAVPSGPRRGPAVLRTPNNGPTLPSRANAANFRNDFSSAAGAGRSAHADAFRALALRSHPLPPRVKLPNVGNDAADATGRLTVKWTGAASEGWLRTRRVRRRARKGATCSTEGKFVQQASVQRTG